MKRTNSTTRTRTRTRQAEAPRWKSILDYIIGPLVCIGMLVLAFISLFSSEGDFFGNGFSCNVGDSSSSSGRGSSESSTSVPGPACGVPLRAHGVAGGAAGDFEEKTNDPRLDPGRLGS